MTETLDRRARNSGPGEQPVEGIAGSGRTASRMWSSRLIGALFLAGFLTYGIGSALVNSVVDGTDFLAAVGSQQTTWRSGPS